MVRLLMNARHERNREARRGGLLLAWLGLTACTPPSAAATEVAPQAPAAASQGAGDAAPPPRPTPIAAKVAVPTPAPDEAAPPPTPAPDEAGAGAGPLPEPLRAAFLAVREDPAPPELTRNSHYWISNEHSHHLWRERLQGVGGAYLGVGSDQNYLLAAWARSELLVLMDFDGAIGDLHRVYKVAFAAAPDPAGFLSLWGKAREAELRGLVEAAYTDPDEQKRAARALKIARALVYSRLSRTARDYAERGVPTFLTDQADYDHVRKLWADGRVFAMRGDLTGSMTLVDVAAALDRADLRLGVLYMSNAEQYFDYGPEFRRNILKLPLKDDAVVVRTLGWRGPGFVEGEQYHYTIQPARKFAAWMRESRIVSLGRMLHFKTATAIAGSSTLDADPPASKRPPDIAP